MVKALVHVGILKIRNTYAFDSLRNRIPGRQSNEGKTWAEQSLEKGRKGREVRK